MGLGRQAANYRAFAIAAKMQRMSENGFWRVRSVFVGKTTVHCQQALVRRVATFGLITVLGLLSPNRVAHSQDQNDRGTASDVDEKAMAMYADAANFQTGGAIDLAIEGWGKYLREYPDHSMAAKASHYLGVCYMQRETPDYTAASKSFRRALQDKKYDLREESLANLGWCQYSTATENETPDAGKLDEVLATYQTLRQESPKSRFLDRALFYSGEAAYGLGKLDQAIKFYDDLLALPDAKASVLRCDALYARGIAYEDQDQFDKAFSSFQQLIDSCSDNPLVVDVRLRLGDLFILRKEYDKSVESFASAIESAESDDDKSYAIFRQAYALVQAEKPGEAAVKYQLLAKQYPDSPYAASATLASAQSLYRSGDIDAAADRFKAVLDQSNAEASTEAAHWLARISLGKGQVGEATKVAREQIAKGVEGEFAVDLQLDLAEALSMNPASLEESLKLFESAYRSESDGELAPRALYNAAFSALQIGKPDQSLKLANEYLQKFREDELALDVMFVAAESHLAKGEVPQASKVYQSLLEQSKPENQQRPVWVLRAITAANAGRKFEDAIAMIERELPTLTEPNQKTEAQLLLGQAQIAAGRAELAAEAFSRAAADNPQGPRSGEAKLLQGQALFAAGKSDAAAKTWEAMVSESPASPIADQARFKLGQLAAESGDHAKAMTFYREILDSTVEPELKPYAMYGIGFSQLQDGQFETAQRSLSQTIKDYPDHPVHGDAMLSRGIAFRNLGKFKAARDDLQAFLDSEPRGFNLGHALYELALVDVKESKPKEAVDRLNRILKDVPAYPSMDKVTYELAWALQDSGQEKEAVDQFSALLEKYPDTDLASEASYFLGQRFYAGKEWDKAAQQFAAVFEKSSDSALREKASYRLGWSNFKKQDYEAAELAFKKQAEAFNQGKLRFDAGMMIGESQFKRGDYAEALKSFQTSREAIQAKNQTSKNVRGKGERQVRELVLLHGGQSAAQLEKWDEALAWYNELRERFPDSNYLSQVFYETGFAYQQIGQSDRALKFYGEVANNYRSELAARARFMMGEIHFGTQKYDLAIPEFQRVMFGFGAEQAPAEVKNWQAKSGFEAGRCAELLYQSAKTQSARAKAAKIGRDFYTYVIQKHPEHELAAKARVRLETLSK